MLRLWAFFILDRVTEVEECTRAIVVDVLKRADACEVTDFVRISLGAILLLHTDCIMQILAPATRCTVLRYRTVSSNNPVSSIEANVMWRDSSSPERRVPTREGQPIVPDRLRSRPSTSRSHRLHQTPRSSSIAMN